MITSIMKGRSMSNKNKLKSIPVVVNNHRVDLFNELVEEPKPFQIKSIQLLKPFNFGARISDHLKIEDGWKFEDNNTYITITQGTLFYTIPKNLCVIRYSS